MCHTRPQAAQSADKKQSVRADEELLRLANHGCAYADDLPSDHLARPDQREGSLTQHKKDNERI